MLKTLALIVDYNSKSDAERLSLQLARSRNENLTILHIDNGNTDVVELSNEQKKHGVELIRINVNEGYASGIVKALKLYSQSSSYDLYWFLNSDLEVETQSLEKLVSLLEQNKKLAAVGPRVFRNSEKTKIWGARGVVNPLLGITQMIDWNSNEPLPHWSYIPGSSILVRRTAYEEAGGLSTRYRMYFEETELCIQLQKIGWDLAIAPDSHVIHHVQSLKESIPARHFAYFFARNQLYFWKHNFNIPWILQLPRTFFVVIKELILPLRRASSISLFLARLGLTLAGLMDSVAFVYREHTYFEKKYFKLGAN